jgi:hypothetical protein
MLRECDAHGFEGVFHVAVGPAQAVVHHAVHARDRPLRFWPEGRVVFAKAHEVLQFERRRHPPWSLQEGDTDDIVSHRVVARVNRHERRDYQRAVRLGSDFNRSKKVIQLVAEPDWLLHEREEARRIRVGSELRVCLGIRSVVEFHRFHVLLKSITDDCQQQDAFQLHTRPPVCHFVCCLIGPVLLTAHVVSLQSTHTAS